MTKILNFALKIKGVGREGGTCKVLRPCHPLKIWNVHNIKLSFFNIQISHVTFLKDCECEWQCISL